MLTGQCRPGRFYNAEFGNITDESQVDLASQKLVYSQTK
jgi:hypothetical protein